MDIAKIEGLVEKEVDNAGLQNHEDEARHVLED